MCMSKLKTFEDIILSFQMIIKNKEGKQTRYFRSFKQSSFVIFSKIKKIPKILKIK